MLLIGTAFTLARHEWDQSNRIPSSSLLKEKSYRLPEGLDLESLIGLELLQSVRPPWLHFFSVALLMWRIIKVPWLKLRLLRRTAKETSFIGTLMQWFRSVSPINETEFTCMLRKGHPSIDCSTAGSVDFWPRLKGVCMFVSNDTTFVRV
jgi:hypothetical protein